MKRYRIFTALPMLAMLLTVTGCSEVKTPTFAKSKGVRFTAYAGPTVANWSGGSSNPSSATEEAMRKLSEAGFNKILALYEGASNATGADTFEMIEKRSRKAQKDALQMLEQAEKFDVKYFVRDWSFYGLVKNYTSGFSPNILTDEDYEKVITKMFDDENEYMYSPAFGGMFAHDEPTYEELERIASQVRIYNRVMKEKGLEGKEAVVNIYPCTVSGAGLSPDERVTYEDYVERYLDLVCSQTGFYCYDYYPLKSNFFDGSYVRNSYLYNLAMVASKLKERKANGQDIELRTFLQSVGNYTGMRDMVSVADFRFQIACEMAFGSREFIYYEYGNFNSAESGTGYALLDLQNNIYNWTYDCAKQANNEAHAMEDAYLSYEWDGVMCKNADEMIENPAFELIEDYTMESHPRMQITGCERDVFAGTFKNVEGDDAFMVVNYTDPYHQQSNKVDLHFNNAKALLMYRYGQRMVVTLPFTGNYTLELGPGEGRFIIPIKQEGFI